MPKKQDEEGTQEEGQGQKLLAPPQKKDAVVTFAAAGIDGPPDEVVTWAVEAPAPIAYYYMPDENPGGLRFAGVPLRNLMAQEYNKLPEWKQRQIKKAKFYSTAPPDEGKGGNK